LAGQRHFRVIPQHPKSAPVRLQSRRQRRSPKTAYMRPICGQSGALLAGVTEPVLQRAFGYLRNVDTDIGNRIEKGVRAA
jgi:hypothetical protein